MYVLRNLKQFTKWYVKYGLMNSLKRWTNKYLMFVCQNRRPTIPDCVRWNVNLPESGRPEGHDRRHQSRVEGLDYMFETSKLEMKPFYLSISSFSIIVYWFMYHKLEINWKRFAFWFCWKWVISIKPFQSWMSVVYFLFILLCLFWYFKI